MKKNKSEIITFKVDESLMEAMKRIPNRSEFIRNAILNALDSVCPLCGGTGIMSPNQKEHWSNFMKDHVFLKCQECHEYHLACTRGHER